MKYVTLGKTGISISRLAFGAAYFGPIGDKITPEEGANLLLAGLEQGINFWDTAEVYGTHPHVACALRQVRREQVVIASKTTEPAGAVARICKELGTDYLDILYSHCIGAREVEKGRAALMHWQEDKAAGRVKALGVTTHSASVARMAVEWPEVDVVMLPINLTGMVLDRTANLDDGAIADMMAAAARAHALGKGVIAMKVLAAGKLLDDPQSAFSFVTGLPYVHSLCVGMRSLQQIADNMELLAKTDVVDVVKDV
jgi:uncharacterized protein